ncbi:MAG: clostripain-related cysteine peptidase [Chloroflexota bacterium]
MFQQTANWQQTILFAQSGDKRTVRAGRRRPSSSGGSRPRAEAPQRDRQTPRGGSSGSGQRPPISSGGGGLPFGSGGKPPSLIGIGAIVLIGLCVLLFTFIFGGGEEGTNGNEPVTFNDTAETVDVDEPAGSADIAASFAAGATTTLNDSPVPPPVSTEGQTWLVMLYQDADDQILEQDIYVDLNEAERVGSNDRVQIVAQVDRFQGSYEGDGGWTSTRRYYVTQDDDLNRLGSQQITDLGELSMADGRTLVDFVTWAIRSYPSDKYVLILSDHGMGWPGGWTDSTPRGTASGFPMASALGDVLYLMELDDALAQIRQETGIAQFELIGMDACLMGHVEVFAALAPHARYAVASQEVEPALGWAYTGFLAELANNPDMTGADLGRFIVESYIEKDQRIVDEVARAEFAGRGSPLGGLFSSLLGGSAPSAAQLTQQLEQNITLTAVDLAVMPTLVDSLNNLAFVLQDANQATVAQARNYAQSFTSVFGQNVPPAYIDLGSFVQLLAQNSGSVAVSQATDDVLAAMNQAIIAEKHGPNKDGANGISIYFPNSQLYQNPVTGPQSYTAVARRFAEATLWDDYLAYHYTGRAFDFTPTELAVPDANAAVTAPGSGQIAISELTLSDNVAAPGAPVLLSADISGNNIGYAYLWVGFYDEQANSIFVADTDYLDSADSRTIDGVTYPDWGTGDFTLEFEWEPLMFAVSDGTNSVLTALTPQSYGAAPEEALYTTDGFYTYADDGETRYARLLFQNGVLRQVFGFNGTSETGAPREIIPQPGDTFTVLEQWWDLDARGQVVQRTTQEGGTLTFGDQMFTWEELDAAAGDYVVGFIIEDLDGNQVEAYATVTVR